MTDSPDTYGKSKSFLPRVVTGGPKDYLTPQQGSIGIDPTPAPPRERTDHEQIAEWVYWLSYRGMIQWARDILGPDATPEQIRDFADKADAWASKTRRPQ